MIEIKREKAQSKLYQSGRHDFKSNTLAATSGKIVSETREIVWGENFLLTTTYAWNNVEIATIVGQQFKPGIFYTYTAKVNQQQIQIPHNRLLSLVKIQYYNENVKDGWEMFGTNELNYKPAECLERKMLMSAYAR